MLGSRSERPSRQSFSRRWRPSAFTPSSAWAPPARSHRSALPDEACGPTWTTDAPYRETVAELTAYRSEGVLTVDMEAATLFTVSASLGLRAASVFCISDLLHGPEWEPHFSTTTTNTGLVQLFDTRQAHARGRS